jgi:mono/diheme cytochrome c family protein
MRLATRRIPLVPLAVAVLGLPVSAWGEAPERSGARLYRDACAACHGADGTGAPASQVAFQEPLPDFTDCNFATREPDADWLAISHGGGPMRGFARMMPAFGEALSVEELQRTLDHVRTLCSDPSWPRGELNLPRPLITEKAYPEDEAVFTTEVDSEGNGEVINELVYEKRFGARNQIEVALPFGWREEPGTDGESDGWTGGLGDVAVGVKRALFHSLERGSIFSVTGEVVLPSGDEDAGFGKGTVVFEPFLTFGQLLPANGFLHLQGGFELPTDSDRAENEAFLRLALGKSFQQGRWGRTWSPMVEVLSARELVAGEPVNWDLVPQVQVTLSTRQHVMANVGIRMPMNDTQNRDTQVIVYLLWDWFDGGFLEGW